MIYCAVNYKKIIRGGNHYWLSPDEKLEYRDHVELIQKSHICFEWCGIYSHYSQYGIVDDIGFDSLIVWLDEVSMVEPLIHKVVCRKTRHSNPNSDHYVFEFTDPDTAMLFKLRWKE